MAPIILLVLVELLAVVASDEDDGVRHQALSLYGIENHADEGVNLVDAIPVTIEKGFGIGSVVQSCVVGERPRGLEMCVSL